MRPVTTHCLKIFGSFVATLAFVATAVGASDGARLQLQALRAEVARHDALYHQQSSPEIGDYDYDQLKQQLRELERAHPELAAETTTVAEIGDDRSGLFQIYRHRERMLSLEKTYAEADVRAFHARLVKLLRREDLSYVMEPK